MLLCEVIPISKILKKLLLLHGYKSYQAQTIYITYKQYNNEYTTIKH